MALSKLALASRALVKLGAQPIASFEEGSAEAQVAGLLFDPVRDALISAHPWNFATAQASLPKLAGLPLADFACAYQLPAGFLRALSLGDREAARGRGLDYRIQERRLHTNRDGVVLTYIFRPEESAFPPFFDMALIARLAAEFSLPLTENTARTEALAKLAEAEFQRAKSIDAQEETPGAVEDWTLIAARQA